jgi:hypothetical protein
MRHFVGISVACMLVAGCSRGDRQADALDRAANQSTPAAAAELHNQAAEIRESGSDSNLADPNSPAQNALQAAGNVSEPSNATHP